jgi:hypothetical protein
VGLAVDSSLCCLTTSAAALSYAIHVAQTSSLDLPGATIAGYGSSMNAAELQRIKDIIEELRRMRQEGSGDHYRHYSGAISSLRHILRLHGKDSEPS